MFVKKYRETLCLKDFSMCACDPDGIQTHDLQNRNLTLYSAKLRDLCFFQTRAKIILFIQ